MTDIRNDTSVMMQVSRDRILLLEKQKKVLVDNARLFLAQTNATVQAIDAAIQYERATLNTLVHTADGRPVPAPEPQVTPEPKPEPKQEEKEELKPAVTEVSSNGQAS